VIFSPNFNHNLSSYNHGDILRLINFYNEDFGIGQDDNPSRIVFVVSYPRSDMNVPSLSDSDTFFHPITCRRSSVSFIFPDM